MDSQDNIIVADWGNARVQIFDQFGSFLSYVNTGGCKLYGPQVKYRVSLKKVGFAFLAFFKVFRDQKSLEV